MTKSPPHRFEKEQILPVLLLGAAMGAGFGLYVAPQHIAFFIFLGTVAGGAILYALNADRSSEAVINGRRSASPQQLNQHLKEKQQALGGGFLLQDGCSPQLRLGDVSLTAKQETGGIFILGRPGSGKTQAFFQLLDHLRQRSDFRVVVLDRGGEVLQRFYRPSDLIFNPLDQRSLHWCHTYELQHLPPEAVAASFIPVPDEKTTKDPIWYLYAQRLLAALWKGCLSNAEVNQLLNGSQAQIKQWVRGTQVAHCFEDARLAASVLFTLTSATQCYEQMPDIGEPISFYDYGRRADSRWLFLPLLEGQTEILKTPMSAAIDLVIRGVLSQDPYPWMKTAIVIDELGALQKLPNLQRFLSESRKYGGTAILGTQTEAQITQNYSKESTRILLQNTLTKLILNCPDPETSELMAEVIGKRRVWEERRTVNYDHRQGGKSESTGWDKVEEYVVYPADIQMLPDLEGFLAISDDSPIAKIRVPLCFHPPLFPAFVSRQ